MAALLAMLRASNEMGEEHVFLGYGPSSRVLRAASTIDYTRVQDDTRPAATPAPCSTANDHDGSSRVQQRIKSGSATRLTTTPTSTTTPVRTPTSSTQVATSTSIGNSAIDGQPDHGDATYGNAAPAENTEHGGNQPGGMMTDTTVCKCDTGPSQSAPCTTTGFTVTTGVTVTMSVTDGNTTTADNAENAERGGLHRELLFCDERPTPDGSFVLAGSLVPSPVPGPADYNTTVEITIRPKLGPKNGTSEDDDHGRFDRQHDGIATRCDILLDKRRDMTIDMESATVVVDTSLREKGGGGHSRSCCVRSVY